MTTDRRPPVKKARPKPQPAKSPANTAEDFDAPETVEPIDGLTPDELMDVPIVTENGAGPALPSVANFSNDRQVDFDALAELAELAVQPAKAPSPGVTNEGGDPFVRMLNLQGSPIAVSCKLVPDRLMDGYKFIVNEPTIPITSLRPGHSQDTPEDSVGRAGYVPVARATAQPRTVDDARKVWFTEMRNDLRTMRHRSDLYWELMRELGMVIANAAGNRIGVNRN